MSATQTNFTYTDPRYFDGDPYEVAGAAVRQAEAAVELAKKAILDAEVMARNAELERALFLNEKCDASAWPTSAQGKRFADIALTTNGIARGLDVLAKAAAFDPTVDK